MSSEVINVGKAMRNQAYHLTGKTNKSLKKLKVQASAVQEEISFLLAKIECDMSEASRIAFNQGMKTVTDEHIIEANGIIKDHTKDREEGKD